MGIMKQPKINPENEEQKKQREAIESIAKNISFLAHNVESLLSGQLSRKAIVLLLAASSRQSKESINMVLDAIKNLERDWLNTKKPKQQT